MPGARLRWWFSAVLWRQGRAGGSPCLDGTRSRDSCLQAWQSHVVNQFKGRQPLLRNTRVENEKLPPGSDEDMGATLKTTAEVSSPVRFACYHRITKTQPETWNYSFNVSARRCTCPAPALLLAWGWQGPACARLGQGHAVSTRQEALVIGGGGNGAHIDPARTPPILLKDLLAHWADAAHSLAHRAFNTTCWVSKGGAGSPGRPARASWVLQPFGFSDRSEQSGCGWPQALFRSTGVPCHRPALWPCQCTHSTHMAGRDSGPSLASPRKTPADQAVSAHFRGGRWARGGEVCPPGRAGRGRARTR